MAGLSEAGVPCAPALGLPTEMCTGAGRQQACTCGRVRACINTATLAQRAHTSALARVHGWQRSDSRAHILAHIHSHTYTHAHTHMHTHTHARTHTYIHTHTHMRAHTSGQPCVQSGAQVPYPLPAHTRVRAPTPARAAPPAQLRTCASGCGAWRRSQRCPGPLQRPYLLLLL